uniref:Prefoldin subunit 6 n=1 Tax=Salix viminalis TaxID=40686 RepID=A0A6N2NIE8_SALVM
MGSSTYCEESSSQEKELDLLNDDANVYKLIGPVLVKQDLAEANANVRKRIDYISAELKRLDGTLQDLEEKQNSKKDAVCGFPFSCLIQFIIEVPFHMPQYGTRDLQATTEDPIIPGGQSQGIDMPS